MANDPDVVIRLARKFGASMAVPMIAAGRVLGGLCVWRSQGAPPFTDSEKQLAEAFASQSALALRLAEGQRDQQRLAVFQDRDRIARDLHDLVIQRLFATGMMLEGAARRAWSPRSRSASARRSTNSTRPSRKSAPPSTRSSTTTTATSPTPCAPGCSGRAARPPPPSASSPR